LQLFRNCDELSLMTSISISASQASPDGGHPDDLKLAASEILGAERWTFQAAMALKYGAGSPRQAEVVFGWIRRAVKPGLHEKRTGVFCLSAQSACAGDKLWDEKHPGVELSLAKPTKNASPSLQIGYASGGGSVGTASKAA
jgi:hypothetical protein